MKVYAPANSGLQKEQPLYEVKAGNLVRIIEPNGNAGFYMVTRQTEKEGLHPPEGTVAVVNATTGRICFKPGHLTVSPLSATISTKYK